jgi:hypothetical protein
MLAGWLAWALPHKALAPLINTTHWHSGLGHGFDTIGRGSPGTVSQGSIILGLGARHGYTRHWETGSDAPGLGTPGTNFNMPGTRTTVPRTLDTIQYIVKQDTFTFGLGPITSALTRQARAPQAIPYQGTVPSSKATD